MTNASAITELERHTCFGGVVSRYVHESVETRSTMRFSVFAPSRTTRPAAVVYYLPGMTCTDETFMIKSGAQRVAAELGLFLVACDTSPRDVRIAGDDDCWDFGLSRQDSMSMRRNIRGPSTIECIATSRESYHLS